MQVNRQSGLLESSFILTCKAANLLAALPNVLMTLNPAVPFSPPARISGSPKSLI
jgi:hypothetical protein